ncbi:hypothetical protein K663_17081 [Sphingobium sp. MI1205]|nr:hypothetical protein K663_17081 [Sphingobium sp. MI1205]
MRIPGAIGPQFFNKALFGKGRHLHKARRPAAAHMLWEELKNADFLSACMGRPARYGAPPYYEA